MIVNVKCMIKAVIFGSVIKFPIYHDTTVNFLMDWTTHGQLSTEAGISHCISLSNLYL